MNQNTSPAVTRTCPADLTDRGDEHRQHICALPEGHTDAQDSGVGPASPVADHWRDGDGHAEEAKSTEELLAEVAELRDQVVWWKEWSGLLANNLPKGYQQSVAERMPSGFGGDIPQEALIECWLDDLQDKNECLRAALWECSGGTDPGLDDKEDRHDDAGSDNDGGQA